MQLKSEFMGEEFIKGLQYSFQHPTDYLSPDGEIIAKIFLHISYSRADQLLSSLSIFNTTQTIMNHFLSNLHRKVLPLISLFFMQAYAGVSRLHGHREFSLF